VWGVRLPGFAGTLGEEFSGGTGKRVLGPEFSQRARVLGIGGTIHNEEGDLRAKYGFSDDELEAVRKRLGAAGDDSFLVAAGTADALEKAMKSIAERARLAARGTVSEVRAVNDDGTTRYLRPMPGAARMYPETDIAPIGVTAQLMARLKAKLPPMPEVRAAELVKRTGLSEALVDQLAQTDNLDRFNELALDEDSAPGADAQHIFAVNAAIARLLLTEVPEVEHEGKATWEALQPRVVEIRDLLRDGRFPKEGLPAVFRAVATEGIAPEQAAARLAAPREEEARAIVRRVVEQAAELVRAKGEAAQGPLMGIAMKELRGKIDGKLVAEWLQVEIAKFLQGEKRS